MKPDQIINSLRVKYGQIPIQIENELSILLDKYEDDINSTSTLQPFFFLNKSFREIIPQEPYNNRFERNTFKFGLSDAIQTLCISNEIHNPFNPIDVVSLASQITNEYERLKAEQDSDDKASTDKGKSRSKIKLKPKPNI